MKIILSSAVAVLSLFTDQAYSADHFASCKTPPGESIYGSQKRLSEKVLLSGLRYAREHSHPITGFVADTVGNYSTLPETARVRASISSTGFMMALVADLYEKGMVSRTEAVQYCRRPLLAVLNKKKSDLAAAVRREVTGETNPNTDISYRGWFAHFIDSATGDRWIESSGQGGSEYATTDSTWFLSGGIVCAGAFPDTDIPKLFGRLFSAVDFHSFMIDGGLHSDKLTLSMSYRPDGAPGGGYSEAQWHIYQHSWLVYLLGLAAPKRSFRLPIASWGAWDRTGTKLESTDSNLNGQTLYGDRRALFSHYFPDVFMPPSAIKEACGIDYFKNSKLATLFNKEMARQDATSKTFQAGLWGLDAGPNPITEKLTLGARLSVGTVDTVRYAVNSPYKRTGTACPACAVASAMFEPDMILRDLQTWCDNPDFGDKIWGDYGPANGINLDYGWISPYALSGIVGPMALSVANLDQTTSVWSLFLKYKPVRDGLLAASKAPAPIHGCLMPE
jgi:hypothetical protein